MSDRVKKAQRVLQNVREKKNSMRPPRSQTKFQNVMSRFLDLEAVCGDEESDAYDDEFDEGNFKVEFLSDAHAHRI